MVNEIWKHVFGSDRYQVSSLGRIRNNKTNRILKTVVSDHGYHKVNLFLQKGKMTTLYVHRLVAHHFIPLVAGKNDVNHKDKNKANNQKDNLEWTTKPENNQHYLKFFREKMKEKICLSHIFSPSEITSELLVEDILRRVRKSVLVA